MTKIKLTKLVCLLLLAALLLTACSGGQSTPSANPTGEAEATPEPDPFAEFTALYEDMKLYYGKTINEYFAAKGYTRDDFDEQVEMQLKDPITINGREYAESLAYAVDVPTGTEMPEEEYNNHRRLSGFSLKTDVYEGESAAQDMLADAGAMLDQVKEILDKSGKWDYGSTAADADESLENLLNNPDKLQGPPYLTKYETNYLIYDGIPPFFEDLPEDAASEPRFTLSVSIYKDGERADRETGWHVSFGCWWYYPILH